jgi:hypothetical protein
LVRLVRLVRLIGGCDVGIGAHVNSPRGTRR